MELINFEPQYKNGMLEIIKLIYNNTFEVYENKIYKLDTYSNKMDRFTNISKYYVSISNTIREDYKYLLFNFKLAVQLFK